ncbi:hypothetical protein FMN50_24540 [Rhodobacterales bacterium]|nr:hypothetical protein FMN50_24540 [Rhodobacterales bacterium]
MQISVETTTQSTSLFSASFSKGGNGTDASAGKGGGADANGAEAPAVSLLEAASKKAEEDAVVIAALQDAVEEGKGKKDDDDKDGALATVEDYQQTAGKLKAALGEGGDDGSSVSMAYESATISTTTIEAEIDGETLSAQFVSFERVSYDSDKGLSVRSASASSLKGEFDYGTVSYQNASVSELYAGSGEQVSNFLGLTA